MTGDDNVPGWLQGRWRLQRSESGLELQPGTRMDFRDNGELIYSFEIDGREFDFQLSYRVSGEVLHTDFGDDKSAAPRFRQLEDGLLELDFGGRRAWFRPERLM